MDEEIEEGREIDEACGGGEENKGGDYGGREREVEKDTEEGGRA